MFEYLKRYEFRGFKLVWVRMIASQLVSCLIQLYRRKIVHCDLKPENVLLVPGTRTRVKLTDFGAAAQTYEIVCTYIQSRHYRAPEILMGLSYDCAIDMWGLGCILAELHGGEVAFRGETEAEQMQVLMETLGVPPRSFIKDAPRRKMYFDGKEMKPRLSMKDKTGKLRKPGSRKLYEIVCSDDKNFLDFLDACFQWDPSRRMNPLQAMNHPFLQQSGGMGPVPKNKSSHHRKHHRRKHHVRRRGEGERKRKKKKKKKKRDKSRPRDRSRRHRSRRHRRDRLPELRLAD